MTPRVDPAAVSNRTRLLRPTIAIAAFLLLRGAINVALQAAIAARFGTALDSDIYFLVVGLGIQSTDLLVATVATGAVPLIIRVAKQDGLAAGWGLELTLLTYAVMAVGLVTGTAFAFTPTLVSLIAPGYDGPAAGRVVDAVHIAAPGLGAYALSLVVGAGLQARARFASTAMAPTLPLIGAGLALLLFPAAGVNNLLLGFGAGSVAGLILQVALWLRSAPLPPAVVFRHPHGRVLMQNLLPLVLAFAGSAAMPIILRSAATEMSQGSVAAFGFANQLTAFGMALLVTPVGVVLLTRISEVAAGTDLRPAASLIREAFAVVAVVSVLVCSLTAGLAQPLVEILYQRGAFSADDVTQTVDAARLLAVAVASISAASVLGRALSAAGQVRSLAAISLSTLAAFLVAVRSVHLDSLTPALGIYGFVNVFSLVLLVIVLNRAGVRMTERTSNRAIGLLLVAGVLAGVAAAGTQSLIAPITDQAALGGKLLALLVSGLAGMTTFILTDLLLGHRQALCIAGRVWRRSSTETV